MDEWELESIRDHERGADDDENEKPRTEQRRGEDPNRDGTDESQRPENE
jgi:hypothetical protein